MEVSCAFRMEGGRGEGAPATVQLKSEFYLLKQSQREKADRESKKAMLKTATLVPCANSP